MTAVSCRLTFAFFFALRRWDTVCFSRVKIITICRNRDGCPSSLRHSRAAGGTRVCVYVSQSSRLPFVESVMVVLLSRKSPRLSFVGLLPFCALLPLGHGVFSVSLTCLRLFVLPFPLLTWLAGSLIAVGMPCSRTLERGERRIASLVHKNEREPKGTIEHTGTLVLMLR